MSEVKTIGVLTSGGDAPGMNAAIRAVVRTARFNELKVMGIRKGYNGLINGDIFEMNSRSVADILHRGGTMLGTARCLDFITPEGMQKAINVINIFGIDGLVVIGGDGSFRGAKDLSEHGIPTVGIPGTIDNDIACSEYTIGFDTALETVKEAIDKLRDTAASHERCSVVEVMGRHAGFIALHAGIATGAESIVIPERSYDFNRDVLKPIIAGRTRGKKNSIVIVAEGIGGSMAMAEQIEAMTGIETRATILGHIQRGGSPTVNDRVVASRMGMYAVNLLIKGIGKRVVVMRNNEITDLDIQEALGMQKNISDDMIEVAKILAL